MQTTKSLRGLCSSMLAISLLALLVLAALDLVVVTGKSPIDVGLWPVVAAVLAAGSLIGRCVLDARQAN